MTKGETDAKPAVLVWANHNNTKHNKTKGGFGLGLQPNPKPKTANSLVRLSDNQGYLSWYFFLSA